MCGTIYPKTHLIMPCHLLNSNRLWMLILINYLMPWIICKKHLNSLVQWVLLDVPFIMSLMIRDSALIGVYICEIYRLYNQYVCLLNCFSVVLFYVICLIFSILYCFMSFVLFLVCCAWGCNFHPAQMCRLYHGTFQIKNWLRKSQITGRRSLGPDTNTQAPLLNVLNPDC